MNRDSYLVDLPRAIGTITFLIIIPTIIITGIVNFLVRDKVTGRLSSRDIIGTWHLLSLQFCLNEDGSKVVGEPAGPEPLGRITFHPNGYMNALITDPRIAHPIDTPWVSSPKEVQLKVAMALSAYCGHYTVLEKQNGGLQISTQVEISLDPNWIGSKQVRSVRLGEMKDGKQTLVLTPTEPFTLANGVSGWAVLTWTKLDP